MPRGCCLPSLVQPSSPSGGELWGGDACMMGEVIMPGEAFEILDVVVERVSVLVVDVVAFRYGPVACLPDFLVEPADPALPIRNAGSEVGAIGPVFGVRVSPEDDTAEADRFN